VRIDLIEKLILVMTVLAVLFVGGTVTLFSIFPRSSGVPAVAVDSEGLTYDWLDRVRRGRGGQSVHIGDMGVALAEEAPSNRAVRQTPIKATKEQKQAAVREYWAGAGTSIPVEQQVRGIPWLKKMPGVKYARPRKVSELLYQKYQSFEDSIAIAKQGGGEFVTTGGGADAYQINWLEENSHLFSRIGLRPGDKVISVNGQPVGKSAAAGQAMFQSMKNERNFSVLIERKGQQLVLSYSVGS
jgi:hypothetical protein